MYGANRPTLVMVLLLFFVSLNTRKMLSRSGRLGLSANCCHGHSQGNVLYESTKFSHKTLFW